MIRIRTSVRRACAAAMLMLLCAAPQVRAQATSDAAQQELTAEVERVRLLGPADVPLRDQATLHLPAQQLFIPQPTASKVMRAMGNRADDRLVGLVYPTADDQQWIVVAEYEASGYVKDDDARDWNADDLLKSLKKGTEASNDERRSAGFRPIEVTGWAEPPAYDAATHRLVWAARAVHPDAQNEPAIVNYNTYALGREGFVSLNLLTDSRRLDADKPHARELLGRLDFNAGKRYADFDGKTDHVAEYGLAALVAGVAAKKLGLIALLGASILKFWKLGLIALAGLGSVVPRLLKRRRADDAGGPPPAA